MKRLSLIAVLAAALLQVCIASAQSKESGRKVAKSRRMPTAAEMRANMEALREKDPARYAQMTNRIARVQEQRLQRTNNRLKTLATFDTSSFTAEERQTHDALRIAIVKREELYKRINPQNKDVTEEQRTAAFQELRDLDTEIRRLEMSERNTLLLNMARSFGLSVEKAKVMLENIKTIDEATNGGNYRSGTLSSTRSAPSSRIRD